MSLGAGDVGTWTDIDVGQHTGSDTAIGAVFVVNETQRDDHLVGLQMKGSNDYFYRNMDKGDTEVAVVGLDNQFAEMKIDSTWVDLWLVGYVTSGAVFFKDAIPHTTSTTGTYVDVDITVDLLGSDDANGAFLNLLSNGAEWFAVRPKDTTPPPYDFYRRIIEQKWPIVGIDEDNIFEQKISATTHFVVHTLRLVDRCARHGR